MHLMGKEAKVDAVCDGEDICFSNTCEKEPRL